MKAETKKVIRLLGRFLFVIYILALIYLLFLSEGYGRREFQNQDYRYNLVPFREICRFWRHRQAVGWMASFLNLGGNVIGFLPLGFIFPVMHRNMKRFWLVTFLGFALSLTVETIQLVCKVGCFDVDDLLLNTIGSALGYVLFLICDKFRRIRYEKV